MPNQPRTPARAVRVEEDLWRAVAERAGERGESISDVIRRALRAYLKQPTPTRCVCSHDRQMHTAAGTFHCTACSCVAFDGRGVQPAPSSV